jgi:hypothetical protein
MVMAKQRSFLGELGTWLRKWEKRPGWTYYAVVHHPHKCNHPRGICVEAMGYAGQTRRKPEARWQEHQYGGGQYGQTAKTWSDTIIRWEIARHGKRISGFKLDRWERKLIIRGVKGLGRPLYNIDWNRLNSDRIKPWEAQQQRIQRDAMRGRVGNADRVASDVPRQRHARRGAGVHFHRDAQGNVIGADWYGDRASEFRNRRQLAQRRG